MKTGYRDVAVQLRGAIASGEYAPGSTLPRQEELATRFGVNVKTVRQAVSVLAGEGLVTPIRRRGTVVRERPMMRRLGIDRYARRHWKVGGVVAFAADREASGRSWRPSDQENRVTMVRADAETAAALGLDVGAAVYERARLITDSGDPTHTLISYYRPEHVEGTPLAVDEAGPAGQGGGFQVLTSQGLEPHRIAEAIHARMPSPDEIQELKLPPGEPVVVLHRTTYTADGVAVEFARGVHAATRFTWVYEFDLPD